MSSHDIIINFVLEESQHKTVRERVVLYRALADICGDNEEAKSLVLIADKLNAADLQYRQFAVAYSCKKPGQLKLDL